MKLIIFLLFCTSVIIFSCTEQAEKKINTDNTLTSQTKKVALVNDYSNFLAGLDTTAANTIPKAVTKYKEIFTSESDALKDSAFVLFNTYQGKVENTLNEKMIIDSTNFDALILVDENNKPLPLAKKLMEYKENIEKNGFKISSTEGMAYIEKNGDYIAKEFYTLVSAQMKTYLTQLNKESKEGFQEDAGLSIEPKTYIDRIIWWEKFIDTNNNFLMLKNAKENYKELLTYLITGMDNTQVTSSENGTIEDYYKVAYTYLQTTFSDSKTNKLIAPYFNALLKKDKRKAEQISNEYRKQKLIIDFHSTGE